MNKKLQEKIIAYIPPLIWMSIIFALSSISTLPSPNIIWWDFIFKKSAHIFMYAVLGMLWARALKKNGRLSSKQLLIVWVICFLYAISDEIHQSFTPFRSPKAMDVGFDVLGATVALMRRQRYI